MLDLYVFTFHDNGRLYRSLSLLSPQEVQTHGLLPEAVLGEINALLPSMTPTSLSQTRHLWLYCMR
ncbi:MAG: hypothetical protein IPL28_09730 [Chloroflexi bacterium]|nr:hypothetical protein [Chloroflexota bacterium]